MDSGWNDYDSQLHSEIDWIDTLVALTYAGLPSFRRFRALASIYFIAAIAFEQQLVRDPEAWSDGYLMSGSRSMREQAERLYAQVKQGALVDDESLIDAVSRAIQPWNQVGLLERKKGNRIAHTAPPKYLLARPTSSSAR